MFVDAKMIDAHLPKANGGKTQVLMCGPPAMMEKAVRPALESLGFGKDAYLEFLINFKRRRSGRNPDMFFATRASVEMKMNECIGYYKYQ